MGGNAFANKWTPRMPPDVYFSHRDRINLQLSKIFQHVATPIEGPAKADFGDIDFAVYDPSDPIQNQEHLVASIRDILNASDVIFTPQTATTNVAIAWPYEFHKPTYTGDSENTFVKADDGQVIPFVQVDVQVCPTKSAWEWNQFRHAHGDFWNILGAVVRPFNLTADEVGFYVRVPEIESHNRRLSKVKLTEDPKEALRFLELPVDGPFWEGPVSTVNEVFEFIALCPMFMVFPDRDVSADRQALTPRERRRTNSRPLFNVWIEEFLPKCRAKGRFLEPRVTKDEIEKRLFETFGPEVRHEYETRKHEFLEEMATHHWNRSIKAFFKAQSVPVMPDGFSSQEQGILIKAYRQMLFERDDLLKSVGVLRPDYIGDLKHEWDEERVWRFIKNSLEIVKIRINELRAAAAARDQSRRGVVGNESGFVDESPPKKARLEVQ